MEAVVFDIPIHRGLSSDIRFQIVKPLDKGVGGGVVDKTVQHIITAFAEAHQDDGLRATAFLVLVRRGGVGVGYQERKFSQCGTTIPANFLKSLPFLDRVVEILPLLGFKRDLA